MLTTSYTVSYCLTQELLWIRRDQMRQISIEVLRIYLIENISLA